MSAKPSQSLPEVHSHLVWRRLPGLSPRHLPIGKRDLDCLAVAGCSGAEKRIALLFQLFVEFQSAPDKGRILQEWLKKGHRAELTCSQVQPERNTYVTLNATVPRDCPSK